MIKIGEYDKNILKLFSGTAIAQAIAFVTIPLIAKLYSPSEYGVYAGLSSWISILSILSTGKYELAIMLPEDDVEVLDLIKLSNLINLAVCISITFLTSLIPLQFLNSAFHIKQSNKLLFIAIPIGTYLLASFQILNYWFVRNKMFSALSFNKILRTVLFGVFSLTCGLYWPTAYSLAFALVISHLFSNIYLRARVKSLKFIPSVALSVNSCFAPFHATQSIKTIFKVLI